MSEERCETVEIISPEAPGGFNVINKSDFDPTEQTIFGGGVIIEKAPSKAQRGRPAKKR